MRWPALLKTKALSRASTDSALKRCRAIYASEEDSPSAYDQDQKDYEQSWNARLKKIMSYIEHGERNISEIFARYRDYWMSGRWAVGEYAEFAANGNVVKLLARSGYVLYRNAVADAVIVASRKDTVAVVELGSGVGESLFAVWGEGRLRKPRYFACEISSSGRKTTRLLGALDPRLALEVQYFDYRKPAFDNIRFNKGHAVVFSTHSIEQVRVVPGDLVQKICAIAPNVTGLHFEPIGWQFDPDQNSPLVAEHRERCIEKKYNTNLWSLLKECEAKGQIRIVEAVPYFFGFAYNPACKIVWEKVT